MRTLYAVVAVLACSAMFASAACPNQCSGHGVCGENDKCTCYTQPGLKGKQRPAWMGADCSQRTCPTGTSFAELSTLRNRVGPVLFTPTSDTVAVAGKHNLAVSLDEDANLKGDTSYVIRMASPTTFQWRLAADKTFTSTVYDLPTEAAEGFQLLQKQGGANARVRIYMRDSTAQMNTNDEYEFTVLNNVGEDWAPEDMNSAHQQVECSGRGTCDRDSGRCACFDGFNGEACQRTACPNDCSGHGVCQDERRFAKDAASLHGESGYTYKNAYDAKKEMGCLCDTGFRGPDCSMIECPSGADPLGADGGAEGRDCSGRGVCDYTAGVCKCFKGYFGERCESQTNYI